VSVYPASGIWTGTCDPAGKDVEVVRQIRDDIERRVEVSSMIFSSPLPKRKEAMTDTRMLHDFHGLNSGSSRDPSKNSNVNSREPSMTDHRTLRRRLLREARAKAKVTTS